MQRFLPLLLLALLPVPGSADTHAATLQPSRQVYVARIGGKPLRYSAARERFPVDAPEHPKSATITTIAYIRQDHDTGRPVVFAFNGGPGSPASS